MRKIEEEVPYLIKTRIYIEAPNQFRLKAISRKNGDKVIGKKDIRVRGSENNFAKFLMKLKAKDVETDPATVRNKKYQDMINTAKDGTDPYVWIWSNMWINTNKIIIKESIITRQKEFRDKIFSLLTYSTFDSVEILKYDDRILNKDQGIHESYSLDITMKIKDHVYNIDHVVIANFIIYNIGEDTFVSMELKTPFYFNKKFNNINLYDNMLPLAIEDLIKEGVM